MNKTAVAQPAKTTSFLPPAQGILQRKCACGNHTMAGGQCAECQKTQVNGRPLQTKLAISEPGDAYEKEADRVAEQVMRVPAPDAGRKPNGNMPHSLVQRRAASNATAGVGEAPPIVHEVLNSSGQPLDVGTRAFMEPRFGHDFSQVRVHTDARAAESARAVDAVAYTVGRNVVFGHGQFAPSSMAGKRLLAHELAHSVQQKHHVPDDSLTLNDPHSQSEREADQIAEAIDQGADAVRIGESSPKRVARFCTPAATCSPGTVIPGSAEDFGTGEEAVEAGPRARRKRMTPVRATSSGHAGTARQLERFLNGQDPTRLGNIQGIFIDQDMSPGTGALTQNCAAWIANSLPAGAPTPPRMAGAVKDCTLVHGSLNQEALVFNTSTAPTIGGRSRERWRIDTLQTLTHETEHPRFEAATAGGTLASWRHDSHLFSCQRTEGDIRDRGGSERVHTHLSPCLGGSEPDGSSPHQNGVMVS